MGVSLTAAKMRQILCLLFLLCVDCLEAGLSRDQQWAGFKTEDQQWAGFKTMYGKKYKSWEDYFLFLFFFFCSFHLFSVLLYFPLLLFLFLHFLFIHILFSIFISTLSFS